MTEKEIKILALARMILDDNPKAILSGSLALYLAGYNIPREIGDIDIIINDYADEVEMPSGFKCREIGIASDGSGIKYEVDGIKVDIMSSPDFFTEKYGLRTAIPYDILLAKFRFSKQSNSAAKKHKDDLEFMNFDFDRAERLTNKLNTIKI